MALNIQPATFDFTDKNFQGKKEFVLKMVLNIANYNDISARTLDWSSSTMPLFVDPVIVSRFIWTLNFQRICGQLTGIKTADEIFKIVF